MMVNAVAALREASDAELREGLRVCLRQRYSQPRARQRVFDATIGGLLAEFERRHPGESPLYAIVFCRTGAVGDGTILRGDDGEQLFFDTHDTAATRAATARRVRSRYVGEGYEYRVVRIPGDLR